MNDHSQITPVTFNEATRKFNFKLLPPACDNLLLSYSDQNGITLCCGNKSELESFRQKLIGLNVSGEANNSKRKKRMQRKMIAALFFAVFVCLFVYTTDFFSGGLYYRWLFNFVTIFMLFALYKIATKYLFGTGSHSDTARLQRDLDLIVIHNRIRYEFSC